MRATKPFCRLALLVLLITLVITLAGGPMAGAGGGGQAHTAFLTSLVPVPQDGPVQGRGQAQSTAAQVPGEEQAVLEEIREYLRHYYVDPLPPEKLEAKTIRALLGGLGDPYTAYLEPEDYAQFLSSLQGSFNGVGLRLEKQDEYIVVVSPIRDSPAARAGIQTGDRILAVDGHSLVGASVERAMRLMRGEAGSPVLLTIWREGRGRWEVRLVRETVHLPSVSWERWSDGTGYIRLEDFAVRAGEEVGQALRELGPVKGLILDLRGNPGGLLEAAVEVAQAFVPSGPVVQVYERGRAPETLQAKANGRLGLPLVVLVDRGTASAAEIVAGAIQDYRTGVLVGERTFGKGSVQAVFELHNGGALKLSVARYRTALGREVDGRGLEPDYPVTGREDQEAQARRLLAQGLRPGRTLVLVPGNGVSAPSVFVLRQGRAYVPLRFFTEILGVYGARQREQGVVLLRYGPHEILLKEGAGEVWVADGTLWLPLRRVVEGLGGSVFWDAGKRIITTLF